LIPLLKSEGRVKGKDFQTNARMAPDPNTSSKTRRFKPMC